MFEADIHLGPLHISIVDIYKIITYKVFEPLVCCLKVIWGHPYKIKIVCSTECILLGCHHHGGVVLGSFHDTNDTGQVGSIQFGKSGSFEE
jgi:hypothetical protein